MEQQDIVQGSENIIAPSKFKDVGMEPFWLGVGFFILVNVIGISLDQVISESLSNRLNGLWELCIGLMVIVSAIWTYKDAKKLEMNKYKSSRILPTNKSLLTAFLVWILWIIAFPVYLNYRRKLINGKIPFAN